jgi:outer membrane receptor protein involved in Fe transport
VSNIVGQLDFGAFADAADLTDGNSNLGNPDLRPDQSWIGQLEVEQRWGEQGNLTLGAVYETIEDVLGLIPVDTNGDGRADREKLGNLPEATIWGFDVEARVPLDSVLSGLEVNLDLRWRDSELRDPLTGRDRVISGEDGRSAELAVTRTLADGRWRWEVWAYTGDKRIEFRRDQITEWGTNSFSGAWLAYRDPAGVSWELGLENPLGNRFTRDRTDFVVDRVDGRIEQRQYRFREIGPTVYLELTWNL